MGELNPERRFKLHGIELISFSVYPQPDREYPKSVFEFNINQEQKTNDEKKIIIVFTSVTIRASGNETILASIYVACGFEFSSFEEIFKKNTAGIYLIPQDLSTSINRISIATTRGILYSQLRGSYLQGSTIPILDIE
jgi:hypothetical protein